ncbi:ferrochelatase, partial [archaeon]
MIRLAILVLVFVVLCCHATAFRTAFTKFTCSTKHQLCSPTLHTSALHLHKSEGNVDERIHDSRLFSTQYRPAVTSNSHRIKCDDVLELNNKMKLGVLFLNLGGPEKIDDVEGFLFNLFADPDIIRLPTLLRGLQKPLAYVIAKRRAPKSSEAYKSIGGGSPIVNYTTSQAQLVEKELQRRGFSQTRCYFAMRYWHPYTEDVLERMRQDGVNTMVIVPLYPQYSISTSGSSLRLIEKIFDDAPNTWGGERVAHTVVPAWYFRPGYVRVMAQLIVQQIASYSLAQAQEGIHVLFSAHGVPQSYIEAGDPYARQIQECITLIDAEVRRQLRGAQDGIGEEHSG